MIIGMDNIKHLLQLENIYLSDSVWDRIVRDVESCNSDKFHVSLLLDQGSNLISYGHNEYFSGKKYPFTCHSEVNCINSYYGKKIKQYIKDRKKILIILRLSSKIKKLGQSKPCKKCHNFIENNIDNLNIKKIIYSTPEGFVSVKSNKVSQMETILSSGYRALINVSS
jgi:cytidine deaminase